MINRLYYLLNKPTKVRQNPQEQEMTEDSELGLQQKTHKPNTPEREKVSYGVVMRLGLLAFQKTLSRKQTKFRELLEFVKSELQKFRHDELARFNFEVGHFDWIIY